jgi:hypothetical protein
MFRKLSLSMLIAVTALTAMATSAQAAPAGSYRISLKTTFRVAVPPDANKNGWCYDAAVADPRTHVFYLADTASKRITVIHPASKSVGGIGTGQFTGIGKCHQGNFDGEGPNGLAITGGAIYAGNGNSHVLGYSLRTGRLIANYNTGGKLQADELTMAGRYLVVTNSAETPHPFISFIDLRAKRIVARYTFTRATGGLGGLEWWHGHLYISVSATRNSPNGGEVDELGISDVREVRIVHRFTFATCQPAGLAITASGLTAVGCGGPSQVILNVRTGHQTPVSFLGSDLVAARGSDFFFISYITNKLIVVDPAGKILQTLPTAGASHTVTVDPSTGDVWVPEDKGDVSLYAPAA